nr:hypothetical protein [Tanacetum cinerariifolium]
MMMYLKNVAGFKLDYFKGMYYDDIRPIFEAKFNSNVDFLLKTKEKMEEDENRALQKINETPAERETKRRKLDEEVEDLKIHLQIVPNEDDDSKDLTKRLKIERCNARIAFSKPQREETYQVTLEDLKKCLIILNQEFIAPPSEEELVTFIQELGYSGRCNMLSYRSKCTSLGEHLLQSSIGASLGKQQDLTDSKNHKLKSCGTYYDFATGKVPPRKARKYKKVASPSRKLSPVKEAEPVKKAKRVKRHFKKSTAVPTAGVAIKDTLGVSASKKKAPAKADRSKGIEILFDVALSKASQLKEATKRSKKDFHISQENGSGDGTDFELVVLDEQQRKKSGTDKETGTKLGVPDIPEYQYESDDESWGDSEGDKDDLNDDDDDDDNANDDDSKGDDDKADIENDGNSDADDNERADLDDDENPSFTLKDYDEKEHDEEYEFNDDYENVFEEEDDDLYKDVDVRSLGTEHEKEGKGDEEMTEAYQNVLKKSHTSKSKFLILENVPPAVDEDSSMMKVKNLREESSTQAPSLFTMPETTIPTTSTTQATTIPLTISMITPLPQLTTPSPTPTTIPTTILIPTLLDFSSLFDDLLSTRIKYATRTTLESYTKEFEKKAQEERKLYIDVVEKSIKHIIKDEVKSLLPQILPKEVSDFTTPVIQSTINESLKNIFLAKSSSQPKSTYEAAESLTEFELKKILLDKIERNELVFKTADTEIPQNQEGKTDDQPNAEITPKSVWFKKPKKPLNPDRAWNDGKSIDFRPPQKWINNIAKASQTPRTYLTLGPKQKKFYGYSSNRESKHDVFSKKRIIALTHVKVMKWYDYGYLEEIIIRKEDQTLYKFKEGDFPRLNLRVVILKRVEDLQLRVESYQKKLNLTKPETFRYDIINMTPYTAYKNPQGVIYPDKYKRNRLMHSDELYKFCNGTLTYVRNVLHDIANNMRMKYLPKRS